MKCFELFAEWYLNAQGGETLIIIKRINYTMTTHYVYLQKQEVRLIISATPIIDPNYHLFMDSTGANSMASCKAFCAGYIYGSESPAFTPINDISEFI
jgi:hypothetical protein